MRKGFGLFLIGFSFPWLKMVFPGYLLNASPWAEVPSNSKAYIVKKAERLMSFEPKAMNASGVGMKSEVFSSSLVSHADPVAGTLETSVLLPKGTKISSVPSSSVQIAL